jgi:hypothetical protein
MVKDIGNEDIVVRIYWKAPPCGLPWKKRNHQGEIKEISPPPPSRVDISAFHLKEKY